MSDRITGERRKEILTDWKDRHPDMGVFAIVCKPTGRAWMATSRDLSTAFNRHLFQLKAGMHPNRDLSAAWKEYGEEAFSLETVETLDYKEEEPTRKDLEALLDLCLEGRAGAGRL
jgi:hypothetical protein